MARETPGQDIPDGALTTMPPRSGAAHMRGLDEQVAKADNAVAGKAGVKRNRFITLSGTTKSVNRAPPPT